MANERFEMVAKTFQGLEEVLAEELRAMGAENVEPGKRMVSFEGDLEMLYRANLSCRTALRILKPIYKFIARNTDELYEYTKEFDWGKLMSPSSTFSIDTVAFSDEFTHSRFVTYRVKDAIVDWFKDRYGDDVRPGVRLQDADVMINVHIAGDRVTLSLDSSGESLHKRGYRVAQTEAPINEVLAAGIILKSGWRGDAPLVDPMCGSGTFLIEAALIAANINPGIYRKHFSFENWRDFDPELFDRLYNDDSHEKDFDFKIYGADISPKAIEIAARNIKSAGVGRMIELETKPLSAWTEAPENGVLITNPPYGERISSDDMDGLYELIGNKLKNVFKGYHAWIIGYHEEYFHRIGLAASTKVPILNGALECQLREYIIFEGDYKHFRSQGGRLREAEEKQEERLEALRDRKRRDFRKDREFRRDRPFDREKNFKDRGFDRDRRNGARPSDRFSGKEKEFGKDREFRKNGDSYKDRDFRKDFRRDDDRPSRDRRRLDEERPFREKRAERRENRAQSPRNKLEERYRPGKNRFQEDRPYNGERPYSTENPLAIRRNPDALKSITGKKPSLPVMRPRKGWRKDTDDTKDAAD